MGSRYCAGFEFNRESVRALIVDILDGRVAGMATRSYRGGVNTVQRPGDWLDAAGEVTLAAMIEARIPPEDVIGIGIAVGGCGAMPIKRGGTPLCELQAFRDVASACPNYRGAASEAERMNSVARQRKEPWLPRCGGEIGGDWFFPKVLAALNNSPAVYDAADLWVDAGDWIVGQWIDEGLSRSACQAGFRAMWNPENGYPSAEFFSAVHPPLGNVLDKIVGSVICPGTRAGGLNKQSATRLGLPAGTAVSAAIIDSHAQVAGAGVASPSTMVLVMEEVSSQLMNSRVERPVGGVIGPADGGILPGYVGYELGIPLNAGEASAFALRRMIERMRENGVPVRRFVASGSLAETSPELLQLRANVLNEKIAVAQTQYPQALGAAILACLAAGPEVSGYKHMSQAVLAMARQREDLVYRVDLAERRRFDAAYAKWKTLGQPGPAAE